MPGERAGSSPGEADGEEHRVMSHPLHLQTQFPIQPLLSCALPPPHVPAPSFLAPTASIAPTGLPASTLALQPVLHRESFH